MASDRNARPIRWTLIPAASVAAAAVVLAGCSDGAVAELTNANQACGAVETRGVEAAPDGLVDVASEPHFSPVTDDSACEVNTGMASTVPIRTRPNT